MTKLVRYLFVGLAGYFIEMIALYLLKYVFDLPSLQAVAISFWIGFFVAFVLQKLVTFQNHDKQAKTVMKQLLIYACLVAFNYVFCLLAVSLLDEHMNVMVIRSLTVAVITCWNFIIYNKIIFRLVSHDGTTEN